MTTSGLPSDNKFLCGYDICNKGIDYCDDPSGEQNKDFIKCKPCRYSLNQCYNGDFVPGCAKYCFETYKRSLPVSHELSFAELIQFIAPIIVLLIILVVFIIVVCKCFKPKNQYRKLWLRCFPPKDLRNSIALQSTVDGASPHDKLLGKDGQNKAFEDNKMNGYHGNIGEMEETPTLPKSLSEGNIHNQGSHDPQHVEAVIPEQHSQNTSSNSSPSPERSGIQVDEPEAEVIRLTAHPKLNNIINSSTDKPEPLYH